MLIVVENRNCQSEFETWTGLFSFHIVLILLVKNMNSTILPSAMTSNIEQVLVAAPHKAAALRPPTSYHENYQN